MGVELDHTIIHSHDAEASARFMSEILGLADPVEFGRFQVVKTANGVSMDFANREGDIPRQHYAFLVSEAEFDEIFGRIQERGLEYWADPRHSRPGEISTHRGRGCYFRDPSGHSLEIITRRYDD